MSPEKIAKSSLLSEVNDFINNPRISLNEISNNDIKNMLSSGMNFHFEVSDNDVFYDEDLYMFERFEKAREASKSDVSVTKRINTGSVHCWFLVLAGQSRHGARQPNSWTPEFDADYEEMTEFLNTLL